MKLTIDITENDIEVINALSKHSGGNPSIVYKSAIVYLLMTLIKEGKSPLKETDPLVWDIVAEMKRDIEVISNTK